MQAKVTFNTWDYNPSYHKDNLDILVKYLQESGHEAPTYESFENIEQRDAFSKFLSKSFELDLIDLAKTGLPFQVCAAEHPKQVGDFFIRLMALVKNNTKSNITNNNTITFKNDNTELHKFNECKVEEECCTDELNKQLNEGWRIIAVCYQKGARRPDYVLGRVK